MKSKSNSFDRIELDKAEGSRNYPIEFLTSINSSGLPPHKLILKGCMMLMVLRNVAPKCNLYNGSRVIVRKMIDDVIGVCFQDHPEEELYLPRIDLSPSDSHI